MNKLLLVLIVFPFLAFGQEAPPANPVPHGNEPLPTILVVTRVCGIVSEVMFATPMGVKILTRADQKNMPGLGNRMDELMDKIGTPGFEVVSTFEVELQPGCTAT